MNNHIIACRYGASTDKFDNHVFKCSSKNDSVPRKFILKVMLLWQSIMKINCYVMNHTYIKCDLIQWTANCFTIISTAACIKMICHIETLHNWRNLNTRFLNCSIIYIYIYIYMYVCVCECMYVCVLSLE